jgi:hypothetical protein
MFGALAARMARGRAIESSAGACEGRDAGTSGASDRRVLLLLWIDQFAFRQQRLGRPGAPPEEASPLDPVADEHFCCETSLRP